MKRAPPSSPPLPLPPPHASVADAARRCGGIACSLYRFRVRRWHLAFLAPRWVPRSPTDPRPPMVPSAPKANRVSGAPSVSRVLRAPDVSRAPMVPRERWYPTSAAVTCVCSVLSPSSVWGGLGWVGGGWWRWGGVGRFPYGVAYGRWEVTETGPAQSSVANAVWQCAGFACFLYLFRVGRWAIFLAFLGFFRVTGLLVPLAFLDFLRHLRLLKLPWPIWALGPHWRIGIYDARWFLAYANTVAFQRWGVRFP